MWLPNLRSPSEDGLADNYIPILPGGIVAGADGALWLRFSQAPAPVPLAESL